MVSTFPGYQHAKTVEVQQRSSSVATQQTTVSSVPSHPSTTGVSNTLCTHCMGSLKCNTPAPENLRWVQPLASLQWCTRALHHWHHCCYRCNHASNHTQTHSPVVLGVETFNQRGLWNLKVHKSDIYHQNRTSYKLLASSGSYGKGTLCFHTLWLATHFYLISLFELLHELMLRPKIWTF